MTDFSHSLTRRGNDPEVTIVTIVTVIKDNI
jgi:hypothetical protein